MMCFNDGSLLYVASLNDYVPNSPFSLLFASFVLVVFWLQ